jgi:hypothetical protein
MGPTPLFPLAIALGLGAFALAGCGARPDVEAGQAPAVVSAGEADYLAPPALTGAVRVGGRLTLTGTAPPDGRVQLASPDGRVLAAAADERGAWTLTLPAPAAPAMFAFSVRTGDRIVRGEGAVLLPPAPAPAALLLRSGYGALSVGQAPNGPAIIAVDYDASGGAAVAGLAPPNTAVRLSLDGVDAAAANSDSQGRFAVMAVNRMLAPGARTVQVVTTAGSAEVRIAVSPASPLHGAAYRATRQGSAWRIDWTPPGGGVQTSLVFDAPGRTP